MHITWLPFCCRVNHIEHTQLDAQFTHFFYTIEKYTDTKKKMCTFILSVTFMQRLTMEKTGF